MNVMGAECLQTTACEIDDNAKGRNDNVFERIESSSRGSYWSNLTADISSDMYKKVEFKSYESGRYFLFSLREWYNRFVKNIKNLEYFEYFTVLRHDEQDISSRDRQAFRMIIEMTEESYR